MSKLTHFDAEGRARMVDVSDKAVTTREAVAEGFVAMGAETLALALSGTAKKGDVRAVAELAGVMAALHRQDGDVARLLERRTVEIEGDRPRCNIHDEPAPDRDRLVGRENERSAVGQAVERVLDLGDGGGVGRDGIADLDQPTISRKMHSPGHSSAASMVESALFFGTVATPSALFSFGSPPAPS